MLSNEKPKRSAGIFDEKRRLITSCTEQLERWKQHPCEVLNREVPEHPVDVEETDEICENHLRRTIHTSDQKCN